MKEVDCALIFMLEEEKKLFLDYNKDFILLSNNSDQFTEFIFFDKDMTQRKGVICSNGIKMGNTEACALFYKLTRYYKAQLYINLGVAGLIKDMNIGDVLIPNRISTMGENNANNEMKQTQDLFSDDQLSHNAVTALNKINADFSKRSVEDFNELIKRFKEHGIDLKKYKDINTFKNNKVVTGWCLTVPEVIKDREREKEISDFRKLHLIDMEAYYIGFWHKLIANQEPEIVDKLSEFLVFKSVSDYGDENKNKMEECGSRNLAMKNLYSIVSLYCTKIYEFTRIEPNDLYSYFHKEVSKICLDRFSYDITDTKTFEDFFKYIIYIDDDIEFDNSKCVESAIDIITKGEQALFLFGRSGTGKSTFMSYLYRVILNKKHDAVFIDFSKFSKFTNPSDKQVLSMIERLLAEKKELIFFFDGIDTYTDSYKILKNMFDKYKYPNLSFCIGNIKEEDDLRLYDTISWDKQITDLSFNGISVKSPLFKEFIIKSKSFFEKHNKNYDDKTIANFIIESKIGNVDFQLLSMFSEYSNDLSKKKCLHTFVKEYLSGKYRTRLECCKWFPPFEYEKPEELPIIDNSDEILRIRKNSYFNSLGIALEIVDMFEKNDEERIKKFFKNEYILSDDMNLFFEHILKQKHNCNNILGKILLHLNDTEVSRSVETQLIYSISQLSVKKNSNPYYDKIKNLVVSKCELAEKKLSEVTNEVENFYWLIEYRTLCIILSQCYNISDGLKKYNKKILEKSDISRCNLIFHLFYYSKRNFSFIKVYEFSLEETDYEMFCNTYYKLKSSLSLTPDELISYLLIEEPFMIMNVITFLHLIKEIIVNDGKFNKFVCEVKEFLNELFVIFNEVNDKKESSFFSDISKLIVNVISGLLDESELKENRNLLTL